MKKLLELLKIILNFLTSYMKYKNDKSESISDLDKTKQDIDKAVYNNDDDYINELLNRSMIIILSLSLLFTGCTSVTYIPSDRQIKSITYDGVEGKFVPNSVFSELLKSKVERDYYYKQYGPIKWGIL